MTQPISSPQATSRDSDLPGSDSGLAPAQTKSPRGRLQGRRRTILVGLLVVLSSLGVLLSTVGIWVRQTALNDDRWAALSARVVSDPEVQASVSRRLASQVVESLAVQDRVAAVLPERAAFLAGPMTNALQNQLETRIATVLASPEFQNAWVEANRIAHHQIVALLRGDTVVVTIENGQVQLNLLPLVSVALHALQDAGVIPATVTLPDLTSQEAQDAAVAKLEAALNVDLPPDFGSIPLGDASTLESAQTALRAFDILLLVTIVLTVAFMAATIWLSRSRLRGILAIALGSVVALVLARLALQGIESAIVNSVANADGSATLRGLFDAMATDLVGLFRLLIIAGVVVAIVAYIAGRPAWLVSIVGSVRASIRRAPAEPAEPAEAVPPVASAASPEAMALGAADAGALPPQPLAAEPSRRAALAAWATRYYQPLRWGGVALVVFALAWASLGWEVAVLAAAVLAMYEFGLDAITRPEPGGGTVEDAGAEVAIAPSM